MGERVEARSRSVGGAAGFCVDPWRGWSRKEGRRKVSLVTRGTEGEGEGDRNRRMKVQLGGWLNPKGFSEI